MADVNVSIGATTADFDKAVSSLSSTMTAQTSRINAAVAGSMGSLKRELDQARRALERMAITDPGWSKQAAQVANLTTQLQRMQGAMRGSGGNAFGGMYGTGLAGRLGGASLQVQDIAVQMQMGTRMSTIIAQQGSQMLSVFGAGGAIAGGVVAVGGAFYAMGENAKKAFADSQNAAREFATQFEVALQTADMGGMISQVDSYTKRWQEASDQFNKLHEDSGTIMKTWMASLMGGPSVEELKNELNQQMEQNTQQREKTGARLAELSRMEADMGKLRAQGRKDEADEMERQLKIARETQRIQALDIPQNFKDQMIADLGHRFAAPTSRSTATSAFGPLKGDIDTSFGRGHQLNLAPEMTIREMIKQANLLKEQNAIGREGNQKLDTIANILDKKRYGSATYN